MTNKYKIKIYCKNKDYFLKMLISKNIFLYNIEFSKNGLIIIIDNNGLDELKKLKTSYKFNIIDYYGISKLKYIFKKYYFLLFCIFYSILLNIILSNIIFSIDVDHSSKKIRDIVYEDLRLEGIQKYKFKVSFNEKNKIIKKILNKEKNNLEWIEIEERGVKYIVKVVERKKNNLQEDNRPKNVIAKKDCMITRINADSGEVLKKKYDYVKKGDILISGIIHNKDEEVSVRSATGVVYGEVWYISTLEIPVHFLSFDIINNKKYMFELKIFNHNINLFNKYKNYIKNEYNILDNKLLPIKLNLVKYFETVKNEKYYNLNNIDKIALKLSENNIKNKYKNEIKIVSKKVLKKYKKNSKIIVEVFFKVEENITDYALIDDNLIKE